MKDTLFLSDLDGTLLTSGARLSDYTKDTLNRLIAQGLRFSIATARSWASASKVLEELNLNLPVVLYNGVGILDPVTQTQLRWSMLNPQTLTGLRDVIDPDATPYMVYAHLDGRERVSYLRRAQDSPIRSYLDSRVGDPRLRPCVNEAEQFEGEVYYISLIGPRESLIPTYELLRYRTDISVSFLPDVYDQQEYWLEIADVNAAKSSGALWLKQYAGVSRVISFGDNLNDLPMFEVCDQCYAVANALPRVRARATGVIDSNARDGVARWIARAWEAQGHS